MPSARTCRGQLAAPERRVAYDSLPAFKALHTALLEGDDCLFPVGPGTTCSTTCQPMMGSGCLHRDITPSSQAGGVCAAHQHSHCACTGQVPYRACKGAWRYGMAVMQLSQELHVGCRGAGEEDEHGQPQESAVWDLLALSFVSRSITDGSFVEVASLLPHA